MDEELLEQARRGEAAVTAISAHVLFDIASQSTVPKDLAALVRVTLERMPDMTMDRRVSIILSALQIAYAHGYIDKSTELTYPEA